MVKNKTAKAEPVAAPKAIMGAIPSRKRINGAQVSFVAFEGAEPSAGDEIEFTAINGVKYAATIASAVTLEGLVTCELSDGPYVVTK